MNTQAEWLISTEMAPLVRFKTAMASFLFFFAAVNYLFQDLPSHSSAGPRGRPSSYRPLGWSDIPSVRLRRKAAVPGHVRVLIRTHEKELLQLRSLIFSLRSQRDRSRWLHVDFVLVPTEPGAQETYRALSEGAWGGEGGGGAIGWVQASIEYAN
jgi:hypothetical protein